MANDHNTHMYKSKQLSGSLGTNRRPLQLQNLIVRTRTLKRIERLPEVSPQGQGDLSRKARREMKSEREQDRMKLR